jgi:Flp pilus assembly protein TadB
MAQTRKRRRTKHRGNAAGVIEARGRTGRKLTADERKPTAKETRQQRWEHPPTWRSAATRAAFAAVIFGVLVVALMGRSVAQAGVIAVFMLVLYIPLGYYMDLTIYRRRKRRASQGGSR